MGNLRDRALEKFRALIFFSPREIFGVIVKVTKPFNILGGNLMKKFINEYFIGFTAVNVIFWILYKTSEKFRKKYWGLCIKLADCCIKVCDEIEKKDTKKVNG